MPFTDMYLNVSLAENQEIQSYEIKHLQLLNFCLLHPKHFITTLTKHLYYGTEWVMPINDSVS